ncbi:hypothetical protein [Ideonella oryzae]|uniref:DUF1127 domain-containing protein n=1 Tax=Ideonella oryzae TaxID=2937441 RepID=A0ABT1BQ53_9BURK|nr:hypothetical protein [Ideonella oryzae]MCO5978348.1 hypothetical protein [Ideonella oryzae]
MSTLLRTFLHALRRWLPVARPGLPTQARELRDLGLGDGELGYWLRQGGTPRRLVDEPGQD